MRLLLVLLILIPYLHLAHPVTFKSASAWLSAPGFLFEGQPQRQRAAAVEQGRDEAVPDGAGFCALVVREHVNDSSLPSHSYCRTSASPPGAVTNAGATPSATDIF